MQKYIYWPPSIVLDECLIIAFVHIVSIVENTPNTDTFSKIQVRHYFPYEDFCIYLNSMTTRDEIFTPNEV